ncbi:MAG: class I SAM-dependent methyltransferase [Phycisphaerae bacterium]|nr:class I SAM-dependent methyltransferase [Phycisphaerae bacterium]
MSTTIVPAGEVSVSVRAGPVEALGRWIVRRALSALRHGRVELLDGDDRLVSPDGGGPRAELRVLHPGFYSAVAFRGTLGAGESYMDGHWVCDDIPALVEVMATNYEAMERMESPLARVPQGLARIAAWLKRNTPGGSRRNIAAHYDLSNDFFELFLDPTMTYSCAVFDPPGISLEEAQREKLDRACRKLALRPTDHLLEIGTGWGSLAVHAARRYGCRVTTTTISERQFGLASRRVREAGLADRVTVIRSDYRDLRPPARSRGFDKLISIEMIEAVGHGFMSRYMGACADLLAPHGMALIQAITIRDRYYEDARRYVDFLKKHIFPGSCLPSLGRIIAAMAEVTDLRLVGVEDIGPHYIRTLRLWREAFFARLDRVRAMGYDDRFIRMWEFYLTYCEGVFRSRHTTDLQLLFAKPFCREEPLRSS